MDTLWNGSFMCKFFLFYEERNMKQYSW